MNNLCDDCKYADWSSSEWYENAKCLVCHVNPYTKIVEAISPILLNTLIAKDSGNAVIYCPMYEPKNPIKRFIRRIKSNIHTIQMVLESRGY